MRENRNPEAVTGAIILAVTWTPAERVSEKPAYTQRAGSANWRELCIKIRRGQLANALSARSGAHPARFGAPKAASCGEFDMSANAFRTHWQELVSAASAGKKRDYQSDDWQMMVAMKFSHKLAAGRR